MRWSEPIQVVRENSKWRIDPDGMMRVTAYILKSGVFRYDGNDLPEHFRKKLRDQKNVFEFIDTQAVSEEVLATLEGKPLVAYEHEWKKVEKKKPENSDAEKKSKPLKQVGTIAGKPTLTSDGYIKVDLLITDADVIEAIKNGELVELSAGYLANAFLRPGTHDGDDYDLEQEIKRFNHVAILPPGKGRCGRDIKILNKKKEGEKMPVTIERNIGEVVERFTFNSDDDAREAKRMVDAIGSVIERRRQNAEDAAATKEKEAEDLKKENEDLGAAKSNLETLLSSLNAKLDKLLALETKEQEGDENAIVAEELNAADEKAGTEVVKEVEKANSLEGRRKAVVVAVARMNGLDAAGWGQEAVDAQFQLLAAKAKKAGKAKHGATRSSAIPPPEGGFKRQNAADEDRITKRVKARNEANKAR